MILRTGTSETEQQPRGRRGGARGGEGRGDGRVRFLFSLVRQHAVARPFRGRQAREHGRGLRGAARVAVLQVADLVGHDGFELPPASRCPFFATCAAWRWRGVAAWPRRAAVDARYVVEISARVCAGPGDPRAPASRRRRGRGRGPRRRRSVPWSARCTRPALAFLRPRRSLPA